MGIALANHDHTLAMGLKALRLGDGCRIDADEREAPVIFGPPVPGEAMHLLLGDEFRQPVGDGVVRIVGEAMLRAGGYVAEM